MREDIGSFYGLEKGCHLCGESFETKEDDKENEYIELHWFEDVNDTRFVHKICWRKEQINNK